MNVNAMNVNADTVADILEGLSELAGTIAGPQYVVILHYAAVLVRLGDEAATRRRLLLTKIQVWVSGGRGPSNEELLAMSNQRQALDDELAAIQASLAAAAVKA